MRLICFIICLCTALGFTTSAQYKSDRPLNDYYRQLGIGNERILQRFILGIGKHSIPGTADLEYNGTDTLGLPINVKTDAKLKSRHSYVFHFGTYLPIFLLSDNSQLGLGIEAMASYTDLTIDSVVFAAQRVYRKSEAIIMGGVPISLDYKTGGEVSLSKANKILFTIGAGVNFCGFRNYLEEPKTPFRPIPFAKMEVGFCAGIAMKLRATAYFGRADFINRKTYNVLYGDMPDELDTKTNTGFGYSISFIILPISYNWK